MAARTQVHDNAIIYGWGRRQYDLISRTLRDSSQSWYRILPVSCHVPNVPCHAMSMFSASIVSVPCRVITLMERDYNLNTIFLSAGKKVAWNDTKWGQEDFFIPIQTLQTFWPDQIWILRIYIFGFFGIPKFTDFQVPRFPDFQEYALPPPHFTNQQN